MLKAGLRFPLNFLHRKLLKYLGLSVSQISPNAWRVFIVMEVLYGAMSNGARSLTVQEFLHCYRPEEIDKSKGMYSFVPRKFVLKVIYETPDSNRDWKSRYFFLEGDGWMCHPGETDHMPIDKTWGILNSSGIHARHIIYKDFLNSFDTFSLFFYIRLLFSVRRRPQIDLKEFNFLEKIFAKSKPEEQTWAKLVNLNTVHWYCNEPEPTPTAIKYEE